MRRRILQECARHGLAGLWWPRGVGSTGSGATALASAALTAPQSLQAASAPRALGDGAPPAACARFATTASARADSQHDASSASDPTQPPATASGRRGGGMLQVMPSWMVPLYEHHYKGGLSRRDAGPPPPPLEQLQAILVHAAQPAVLAELTPALVSLLVSSSVRLLHHEAELHGGGGGGGGGASPYASLAPHVRALHEGVMQHLAFNASRGAGMRVANFGPRALPRLALALARGGAAVHPGLKAEVAVAAAAAADGMDGQQLASMFRALAALDPQCRTLPADGGWLEGLGARVMQVLRDMRGEELAHVLRALGTWRRVPAAMDGRALGRALGAAAPRTAPEHINRALWALSVVRASPSPHDADIAAAARALADAAPAGHKGAFEVADGVDNLARMWAGDGARRPLLRPQADALDALGHALIERGGALALHDLFRVMRSFEALRYVPPPAVADALVSRWAAVLPGASPYHAANLLVAAGTLQVPVPHALAVDTLSHVARLAAAGAGGDDGGGGAAAAAAAAAVLPGADAPPTKASIAVTAVALWGAALLGAYDAPAATSLAAHAGARFDALKPHSAQQLLQAHEAYRLLAPQGDRVEALLPPALLAACRAMVAAQPQAAQASGGDGRAGHAAQGLQAAAQQVPQLVGVRAWQALEGGLFTLDVVASVKAGRKAPRSGARRAAGGKQASTAGGAAGGALEGAGGDGGDGGGSAGAGAGGAPHAADGGTAPDGGDASASAAGSGAALGGGDSAAQPPSAPRGTVVISLQQSGAYARNNPMHLLGQARMREALLRAMGYVVVSVPGYVWPRMSQDADARQRYVTRLVAKELQREK